MLEWIRSISRFLTAGVNSAIGTLPLPDAPSAVVPIPDPDPGTAPDPAPPSAALLGIQEPPSSAGSYRWNSNGARLITAQRSTALHCTVMDCQPVFNRPGVTGAVL